jgi:phosphatidate cytidylyltransferase
MVKKRIITGLGIIALLVVLIWLGKPWWLTILVAIWGLLAVFEFYRMAATPKMTTLTCFGLIWTLLFIISPHFDYDFLIPLLLSSAVILPLIWLLLRPRKEGAFITWAWTIAGILYVGWLLSYFIALRELDSGRAWVSLAIFTNSGSDTTAFFVGRALGRYKLAPSISPGKTWEGAIAGVIGAIAVSLLLVTILSLPIGYGQAILLGSIVSIFGQLGDLAESLLKRNTGVKDSSKLLPGHGGFLDRIDSVVFAGIVVYYYVIWVIL